MPLPRIDDEYPHKPSQTPEWRESYYFNFVDAEKKVSSFSTIGLLPNLNRREFVFALFYGDYHKLYFNEVGGSFENELASLSDGRLSYEMLSPLGLWRIHFTDEDLDAELFWKARFPAYCFGRGSGTSWAEHFEQSCFVSGVVRLLEGKTKKIVINGFGQRDKSWGSRRWHIDNWFALHAQFEHLSIGLRRDVVDGKVYVSGVVSSEGEPAPVQSVDVEVEQRDSSGTPLKAKTVISTTQKSTYTLKSSLISRKSYAKFSRTYQSGVTELFEGMVFHYCEELRQKGTGLLEWLHTRPSQ